MSRPTVKPKTDQAKARSASTESMSAEHLLHEVESHVLRDGLRLVVSLEKSHGSRLIDALTGREFLDFHGGHGSMTVGFNHPYFDRPEVKGDRARSHVPALRP